jgi:hypothetical protein
MDISTDRGIDEFARQAASAANAMGRNDAQVMIAYATEHGHTNEQLARRLTSRILGGADDRWSGRTNDLKRSYFEGFTAAARTTIENTFIYND